MSKLMLILVLLLSACASSLQGLKIRGTGPMGDWCEGTAFVIGPNRLMTAAHVYKPGLAWEVEGQPVTWAYGMLADGDLGHIDLAVVQALVGGETITIGSSDPTRDVEILTHRGTLTARCAGEALFHIEPRLMHGDSGSPVVQDGCLVGVVWGMASEEDGTSGSCVSARALRAFLNQETQQIQ